MTKIIFFQQSKGANYTCKSLSRYISSRVKVLYEELYFDLKMYKKISFLLHFYLSEQVLKIVNTLLEGADKSNKNPYLLIKINRVLNYGVTVNKYSPEISTPGVLIS